MIWKLYYVSDTSYHPPKTNFNLIEIVTPVLLRVLMTNSRGRGERAVNTKKWKIPGGLC